jgi:dnd system-associated protein 4
VPGIPRVRRSTEKEDLLSSIVEGKPFESIASALTFAAALGYAQGRRVPLANVDPGTNIRWEIFQNDGAVLAGMIAAGANDDIEIVAPDRVEDRIEIFEEYANGGLEILSEEIAARGARTPREVVLDLVLDAETTSPSNELDLSVLAEEWSGQGE